jgi:hypothetical protein
VSTLVREEEKHGRSGDWRVGPTCMPNITTRGGGGGATDRRVPPVGANSPGWAGAAHELGGPA